MKTFLFAACLVAALLLSSCKQDPSSVNGPQTILPLKSGPPPANPAITYINGSSVGVMDTTGANATKIVTASSGTPAFPGWKYSGSSITYGLYGATSWAVNAFDVSVNSKGVPVASNARTIYLLTSSDSTRLQSGPAWCATSSTGLIAFTRLHTDKANFGVTDLCTISQSGGTPTMLASYKRLSSSGIVLGLYEDPTWSPDDSEIAVLRQDTNLHFTILIFNASTGAAEDSIPVTGGCSHLAWSRSGFSFLKESCG